MQEDDISILRYLFFNKELFMNINLTRANNNEIDTHRPTLSRGLVKIISFFGFRINVKL